jgi:hypothetical protein
MLCFQCFTDLNDGTMKAFVNSRSCVCHWVSLNVQMDRICH